MPTKMSARAQITDLVTGLSPDEQGSVVDFMEWMRGTSVVDELSREDRDERERRAATIAPDTLVTIADATARIRSCWSGSER